MLGTRMRMSREQNGYQYLIGSAASGPGTTFQYNGVPFGAYHPDRRIIVAVSATVAGPTTRELSATAAAHDIGSDGAPGVTRFNFDSANQVIVGFLVGSPTGTSGTVNVTFDGPTGYCVIAVYRTIGLASATPDATGGEANNDSVFTCDANVTANSLVLGSACIHVTSQSVTWSGLTERYEVDNGVTIHSFADYRALSAETPRSMSTTVGVSDQGVNLAAVWAFS